MYNSVIYADRIIESSELVIPEQETKFSIHFYSEAGEPIIYFNSKQNPPPLKLYTGARWNTRTFKRQITKLVFVMPPNARLWVIIEKL